MTKRPYRTLRRSGVIAALGILASTASGDVLFQAIHDGGFFLPFTSANADIVRYGDSGWLGGPDAPPVALGRIKLGLVVSGSPTPGTTDILFTFNDGDPSGLVFGSGAVLHSTVIANVSLPAAPDGEPVFFSIEIELPDVQTLGGFNDVGWSIGLADFDYAGSLGMQTSTCAGQTVGFYTNNASSFDGRTWQLFAFGADTCLDVANFVVTMEAAERTPDCPGDLNEDGHVDGADLGILLGAWGAARSPADLNGDGIVDGADLGILLGAWGECI